MTAVQDITRPELTLPEAEADWVRMHYAQASTIFEYGSGGSTVLAAEAPGKTVFSVETDPEWHAMMGRYFETSPPEAQLYLLHADIGPVKKWGRPKSDEAWRRYHKYPLAPWDHPSFQHPDVILIDGRFRLACLVAAAYRCTRPVTVLFDDYADREAYHQAADFAEVAETRGRMARFELTPQALPPERLGDIIEIFGNSF